MSFSHCFCVYKCDLMDATSVVGVFIHAIAASVVSLKSLLSSSNYWRHFDGFLAFSLFNSINSLSFIIYLHSIIPWLDLENDTEFWYDCDVSADSILLGVHDLHTVTSIVIFCWSGLPCIVSSWAPKCEVMPIVGN